MGSRLKRQMSVNGKRDGFAPEDFLACAKSVLMKRGRAETIVEEVRTAVAQWPEHAMTARVADDWREQIPGNLRLSLPRQ